MNMINEWKKHVVHLECVGEDPTGEVGNRDKRSQGTAIFIEDNGKRYLVTARHVVHDEVKAVKKRSGYEAEDAEVEIFSNIFRVRSLNEGYREIGDMPEHLMGLGAGPYGVRPYVFSSPELDLAIISLDKQEKSFITDLLDHGYVPLKVTDILEGPTEEGADICAIGYPNTSRVGQVNQHPAEVNWSSKDISLPVSSFGKVAMLHGDLDYFWGDISIYPGNSGGPVVQDGKLVGIVSAQAVVGIDEMYDYNGNKVPIYGVVRIPFARIIKAKHVLGLLDLMKAKDQSIDSF